MLRSGPKVRSCRKTCWNCSVPWAGAPVKEILYYTGASMATVKRLSDLGYVNLTEEPALRLREILPTVTATPIVLTDEQAAAFQGLSAQLDRENPGTALLYGVTGSGKTSIYLKLIQKTLDEGKSAILLVPEIALTPQLLGLVAAYFGDTTAILHSSLPMAERYDQWKRIRSGDARVVVGTRSAIFAPCRNLGLVILDEEQEHSYKSENAPRYAAKEVAIWRGYREGALVLLGSATPTVESMYRAKNGDYALYTLKNRFNGRELPNVDIVDMGEELRGRQRYLPQLPFAGGAGGDVPSREAGHPVPEPPGQQPGVGLRGLPGIPGMSPV